MSVRSAWGAWLPDAATMHGWVAWHAMRRPETPALADRDSRLTYAELDGRVRTLAAHLAAVGVGSGDRVLVALPNVPAAVVAALAVNMLGAVSVEVSRTWSTDMLRQVVRASGVRHVMCWERDARQWVDALEGSAVERVWLVGSAAGPSSHTFGAREVLWLRSDGTDPDSPRFGSIEAFVEPGIDTTAIILYTSGSTGRPSGVIQSVRNIRANTRSIAEYLGLTESDRAFLTLPLAYCYGRSVLQTHLFVGGSVYLENGLAFPRVAMETLASEGCTGFAGVPLTFEIIRRQVDLAEVPRGRLRYVTQAGGAMAPETTAWLREAVRPAGVFVMYGQTEATARLTYLPPSRAEDKSGSVGIPIPGVEVRIVDVEGRAVPRGTVGEIEARGENVTSGYLDDPEATSQILRDGWLRTGDLGYLDEDGFLFHHGRAKEIMKVGGHRVSPAEIEQLLISHPDVVEAGVRGVTDDLMGEVPVAFLVLRRDERPDESALRAFYRERVPQWMMPARFVVVERLPRNEAGKLMRTQLREPTPTRPEPADRT